MSIEQLSDQIRKVVTYCLFKGKTMEQLDMVQKVINKELKGNMTKDMYEK